MALTCTDIDKLVHPYLDGEFSGDDRDDLEVHLGDCEACRRTVDHERAFKAGLRSKLSLPAAPSDLRARVVSSLDEVDARQQTERLPLWEGILHRGALVAAAAAIALFFLYPVDAPQPRAVANDNRELAPPAPAPTTPSAVDLVRRHVDRPIEVAAPDQLPPGFEAQVGVRIEPPAFAGMASLRRAWVNQLPDRRAAQLEYVTRDANGRARVFSVHVFDPSNMHVPHEVSERVGNVEVLAGHERGYNFVFYRRNGVGYAYTSDLDREQLLQLVRAGLVDAR